MQALILAAGMGKRLAKYTSSNTKCMVEVAGLKIIDRILISLSRANINRVIIVVGYKGDSLKTYILKKYGNSFDFTFINNADYASTNNIYSFYLAKDELLKDDTILLESDIVYPENLIKELLSTNSDNVVVVSKYESWMDGTCVTVNSNNKITSFVEKKDFNFSNIGHYYKTVNIYKLSSNFVGSIYLPFLETYMKTYGLNSYYETTLKFLCMLPNVILDAFFMGDRQWYEIDDAQDLKIANGIFSKGEEKYKLIVSSYGGFWRYKKIIDFCYLVNPFFPTNQLIEKMKIEFDSLLTQYPSGEDVQNMNAGRLFNVDEKYLLVGNGAAELINILGHIAEGKIGVSLPTFNEYIRCFKDKKMVIFDNSQNDYSLNLDGLKKTILSCNWTIIINPDNPSGLLIEESDILNLCEFAKSNNKNLIIDESFIDFASKNKKFTLLTNNFLRAYPNVVVIKSISKSYGVPGLRLGVLATSNISIVNKIRDHMQVWNINSFGEYFLQIINLFDFDYKYSCEQLACERERVFNELETIKNIKVYPSAANYLMIDLRNYNSSVLASKLLENDNLLIKDLSTKSNFCGKNMIRVAIRDKKDNDILVTSLKKYLENTK